MTPLESFYQAVGDRSEEAMQRFVDSRPLTPEQQVEHQSRILGILYDRTTCRDLGVDYCQPQATPAVRAYALFEMGFS